jgi:inosine-uridine nucleoside N-ribohydrolase
MASVNKVFGRTGIPVGAYHGGVSSGSSNSAWAQPIAAQFGTADDVRSNYPDAVTTLRTALAAAANGSVTYVSTGFLTNLAALLQSFPHRARSDIRSSGCGPADAFGEDRKSVSGVAW